MDLMKYADATTIRAATLAEWVLSYSAALSDGGAGVIEVDGIDCYVEGDPDDRQRAIMLSVLDGLDDTYDHISAELERVGLHVVGSYRVSDGRMIVVRGWPDPVVYDQARALPVLIECDAGVASTENGDADLCRRLEAAGAFVRLGSASESDIVS